VSVSLAFNLADHAVEFGKAFGDGSNDLPDTLARLMRRRIAQLALGSLEQRIDCRSLAALARVHHEAADGDTDQEEEEIDERGHVCSPS
jgi:hypothetical protein